MSTNTFHWDAIKWLREEAGLATEVRPADRVGDPAAPLSIPGFVVRPSRAGAYAYASLWVFTGGLLLAMLGMPGLSEASERLLNRVGVAGITAGMVLLLVAWVTARRHRDPALVQIFPATAPATVDAITSLRGQAGHAAAWMVAERAPDPEVLATAVRLGVACFGRTPGGRFTPWPAPTAPRGTPAPPDSAP